MSCGIYKIECVITARCYIGQSRNIERRWIDHVKRFSKVCFDYSILEECEADMLDEREIFHIADYNCLEPFGFNKTRGGQSWNMVCTDETRAKLSKAAKGKKLPPRSAETRAKISEAVKNRSLETRAKLSEAVKNRSPETRAKFLAAGQAAKKGKPLSPETRAKLSAAHQNRSPETRAKMSAAAKNMSPETRAKLSAAAKNMSSETRAKMSAARKARWAKTP